MKTSIPLPTALDDEQFSRLVKSARVDNWDSSDVARLATHLATSGERLSWPAGAIVADIASTGGPGSLSTLLAPLVLNAGGARVVKLGVPGRPAGAIDSLATIPGYRAELTPDEARSIVDRCGFVHFLADRRFAPMDAALFQYRKRVDAVALPVLAAASLLSKKLAVGVQLVGLDARIGPHGNFGETIEEARSNAAMFCAAALELGIAAVVFLSANSIGPAQPWIGRGEGLLALAKAANSYVMDDDESWLLGHVNQCWGMAQTLLNPVGASIPAAPSALPGVPDGDLVRAALEAHLIAQGTSMRAFTERVEFIGSAWRTTIAAERAGTLTLEIGLIRSTLVASQAATASASFSDPAGVQLLKRPGTVVSAGEPLASVRCEGDSANVQEVVADIRRAIRVMRRQGRGIPSTSGESAVEVVRA